jgi:hypothetical protein
MKHLFNGHSAMALLASLKFPILLIVFSSISTIVCLYFFYILDGTLVFHQTPSFPFVFPFPHFPPRPDIPNENVYEKVYQVVTKNANDIFNQNQQKVSVSEETLNFTAGLRYEELMALDSSWSPTSSSSASTTAFIHCTDLMTIKQQVVALLQQTIPLAAIHVTWEITDGSPQFDLKKQLETMSPILSIVGTTDQLETSGRFYLLSQVWSHSSSTTSS